MNIATVSTDNDQISFEDASIIDHNTRTNSTLELAYQNAKKSGETVFFGSDGLDCADIVGRQGQLKRSFLLPIGETLGLGKSIGLPKPSKEPKLHELIYSKENNTYWLKFSSANTNQERVFSYVLISGSLSGNDAILKILTQTQKILFDSYYLAKKNPAFCIDSIDLNCGNILGATAQLQMSFLLPVGKILGLQKNIGLPELSKDSKLHNLTYSNEDAGFWLKFSAVNRNEQRIFSNVLISDSMCGNNAIVKIYTQTQKLLFEAYAEAKKNTNVCIETEGIESNNLLGVENRLLRSFLLPTGKIISVQKNIGLTESGIDPKLHSIMHRIEDCGFWLKFSSVNKNQERIYSHVLMSDSLSGDEAIIRIFTQSEKMLFDSYTLAKKNMDLNFNCETIACSDLIGTEGQLQISFLLPNGTILGSKKCIGLPKPSKEAKLHNFTYSKEDRGYWLKLSSVNKNEERVYSRVLISELLDGDEAILKYHVEDANPIKSASESLLDLAQIIAESDK